MEKSFNKRRSLNQNDVTDNNVNNQYDKINRTH